MAENLKHTLQISPDSSPQRLPKIGKTSTHNRAIQRYLVAIEYIGTRFSGSQKQPNYRTVVGVLEEAFQKFIGQSVSVFCSSRTDQEDNVIELMLTRSHKDAGVHALANVCHVDVERISKRKPGEVLPPHEPGVVRRAVNHFLQKHEGDVMVIDVRRVPSDFHARYKAQERTYLYRIVCGGEGVSSFEKDRVWHVAEKLDIQAMKDACKVLVGHHDFSSFRAAGCQAKSPIRTLDELDVCEVGSTPYFPTLMEPQNNTSTTSTSTSTSTSRDDSISNGNGNGNGYESESSDLVGFGVRRRHPCFVVTARARSFLYHQVRLMVGVLKAVGTGDLTIPDVERILKAKDVTRASPMAPACGLYLGHVKYE